jgi:hypothetical protein
MRPPTETSRSAVICPGIPSPVSVIVGAVFSRNSELIHRVMLWPLIIMAIKISRLRQRVRLTAAYFSKLFGTSPLRW